MPNDRLHDVFHTSLFGVQILQQWADLAALGLFLNRCHLRGIAEIGTYKGGLSLYLLAQAMSDGARFITFDIVRHPELDGEPHKSFGLDAHLVEADIFGRGRDVLLDFLSVEDNHPLLLYCDGGNKPREVQMFTEFLSSNDYIAAHDWGMEILDSDIEPVAHLVRPVFHQVCAELGSMTRFWRRL